MKMKMKHSMTILGAALALASGAAFAQGASGVGAAASAGTTGVSVDNRAGTTGIAPADGSNRIASGGTAVVAAPMTTPVAVAPATLPQPHLLPGGTMVQAGSSTTVMGNSTTTTTRYWANVPAGVERDSDFQRWSRLK